MRTPTSRPPHHKSPRAFALLEATAVFAVLGILTAIFVVMGSRSRRLAMASDDLANLRHIGQLTGQYAADHQERFWGFTWLAGQSLSQWPDLNNAPTTLQAFSNQAVDILRRRTGDASLAPITGWLSSLLYSQLVVIDYTGSRSPQRLFISSGDRNRLLWASDPVGFNQGKFGPLQPDPAIWGYRFPYSSSYARVPALFSVESGPNALYLQNSYNIWSSTSDTYQLSKLTTDVAFPSQKVVLHDQHARHFGPREAYFSFVEARVPILLADASASVRLSLHAKLGWHPTNPTNNNAAITYLYKPTSTWEPPPLNPNGDGCGGRYQFTRSATKGRDFGGPEVPYP